MPDPPTTVQHLDYKGALFPDASSRPSLLPEMWKCGQQTSTFQIHYSVVRAHAKHWRQTTLIHAVPEHVSVPYWKTCYNSNNTACNTQLNLICITYCI